MWSPPVVELALRFPEVVPTSAKYCQCERPLRAWLVRCLRGIESRGGHRSGRLVSNFLKVDLEMFWGGRFTSGYWGGFPISLSQGILLAGLADRLNLQKDLRKIERRGVQVLFLQTLVRRQLVEQPSG